MTTAPDFSFPDPRSSFLVPRFFVSRWQYDRALIDCGVCLFSV